MMKGDFKRCKYIKVFLQIHPAVATCWYLLCQLLIVIHGFPCNRQWIIAVLSRQQILWNRPQRCKLTRAGWYRIYTCDFVSCYIIMLWFDTVLNSYISRMDGLIPLWWRMISYLTHWGWDKMFAIFQRTYSIAISWMKIFKLRLEFHRSLFLRFQLTLNHHWFR